MKERASRARGGYNAINTARKALKGARGEWIGRASKAGKGRFAAAMRGGRFKCWTAGVGADRWCGSKNSRIEGAGGECRGRKTAAENLGESPNAPSVFAQDQCRIHPIEGPYPTSVGGRLQRETLRWAHRGP
ncbi:hypothetical protein KM043_008850 [Ampulex compressa]|nr:hypothetical protein KM043_008850 [Ampulex compressa]